MIKISDIAFTGTPVTDMKKARAFYEGVLGLASAHVFEFEGKTWLEYDIGPGKATLAVTDYNTEWKPSAAGTTIAFEVADFDDAIAHLKTHNVAFLVEPYESPVCRMALISDPDGNTITIHQCKQTA
jgi:predicted enzyme related to lactoylglutathione lyase